MDVVLGIDLGTSYFKLGLFDREGKLCGLGRCFVPIQSAGTRQELPVEDFLGTLQEGLNQACRQANAKAGDIRAISYASQANTFLLLDGEGSPLPPLIVWTDLRAKRMSAAVERFFQRADFMQTTWLGLSSGEFAVAKLDWFRRHKTEVWEKTSAFMTISDFLLYQLTGNHTGDAGTASLLGLWDIARHRWWKEGFDTLKIPVSWFSQIIRPGGMAGETTEAARKWLGIPTGIPVIAGSLDHHAAAIGAGVCSKNTMALSLGTVLAALRIRGDYHPLPHCCMGPDIHVDQFFQLGFHHNGAAVLEGYQRQWAANWTLEDLLRNAQEAPRGCEGLTAVPCAHEYSRRKGFAKEKNRRFPHSHYVRAILESVASSARRLIEQDLQSEVPERIIATGGGARSLFWLQILADMLGTEVCRCDCPEPACRGAAMLAATGAGWFSSPEEAQSQWVQIHDRCEPESAAHAFYDEWFERY